MYFDFLPENVVQTIFEYCDVEDIVNIETKRHVRARFLQIRQHLQPLIQRKIKFEIYYESGAITIRFPYRVITYEYWKDDITIRATFSYKYHSNSQIFKVTPKSYDLFTEAGVTRHYSNNVFEGYSHITERNTYWTDFYDEDISTINFQKDMKNCHEINQEEKSKIISNST